MAIGTLVGRSQAVSDTNLVTISTQGFGRDGWAAVRGAVTDLRHNFGKIVEVRSDPKTMGMGQKVDLKAI